MRTNLRSLPFLCLLAVSCIAKSGVQEAPQVDVKTIPSEKLVSCFDTYDCGDNDAWAMADELARRNYLAPLLKRYWKERKASIREGIEFVAYNFDTPEAANLMRKIMNGKIGDGEAHYYAINYLAKQCDPSALRKLGSGRYRGHTNGMQYASSLELFGKCKYRPAIPHLVAELDDSSLNAVIGASHSLDILYPDHPEFPNLNSVQQYYCHRARKDGFKVDCEHFSDDPRNKQRTASRAQDQ